MRIGKFMRFLLISAYQKTVEKKDLNGFIHPVPDRYKDRETGIYYSYLFKSEALNLYFHLEPGQKRAFTEYRTIFKDTPEYRKALVQYSRAIKKLYEYRLVNIYSNPLS